MISYKHTPGEVQPLPQFFRRESATMRSLARMAIYPRQTAVYDTNRNAMEFQGLIFGEPVSEFLLAELGVVHYVDILKPLGTQGWTLEYPVSARYPWGRDRVMG